MEKKVIFSYYKKNSLDYIAEAVPSICGLMEL